MLSTWRVSNPRPRDNEGDAQPLCHNHCLKILNTIFPDFGDREVTSFRMVDEQSVTGVGRITIQEDFGVSNSSVGCSSGIPWWKDLRQRMRNCLPTPGGGNGNNSNEVLVEVKQVGNCCRAKGT